MSSSDNTSYRVLVLDMQPIEPPVGGGRLRLLGLYHNLGQRMRTIYVGTFDWPGERCRSLRLSDTLMEIDVPLSARHFAAAENLSRQVGGKTVIDVTFHQLAKYSPDYVEAARRETRKADAIFFSHPWVFPLVEDLLDRDRQLIVYDSQNVEGYLRSSLLDDGTGKGSSIVREVIRIEHDLCSFADSVLACSHEDRQLFHDLYGIPFEKIIVVPNGAFTGKLEPVTAAVRRIRKRSVGASNKPLAIFLASAYQPNVEAAEFITHKLAPQLPQVTFAICGGVGGALDQQAIAKRKIGNVLITGHVSDTEKRRLIEAADIAINPMASGSGTNIKMLEYMAAGLPVVSTAIGARGIEMGGYSPAIQTCETAHFGDGIREVLHDSQLKKLLAKNGRRLVEERFSWERISTELGQWSHWRLRNRGRPKPYFSVVIPSYERHDLLSQLVERLKDQTFDDFDIVIVDQSRKAWADRNMDRGPEIQYIHTDVKGAINARNKGVFFARGRVIAFIDDDCVPMPSWLESAAWHFRQRPEIIGIEGYIKSDRRGDPDYRSVTNKGFIGVGFMTANLFLRKSIFHQIDGFDPMFDHPHFREDTDLAWRALEYGEIPFCDNVVVYHPPHRRSKERESCAARVRFFEKDPLLYKKHPIKYRELFLAESHWRDTDGFWKNVFRGAEKYDVELPDWMLLYFAQHERERMSDKRHLNERT